MAIIINSQTNQEAKITINNGDLTALKEVETKWKFKSLAEILKFSLAVLVKTDDTTIYVEKNGVKQGFSPADHLLKNEEAISKLP